MYTRKCTYCITIAVVASYAFFLSFAMPLLDRADVRIMVGWLTFVVALSGTTLCFCFAYWQNASAHPLSRALRDVYLATGLLSFATSLMGLGGIMGFVSGMWDLVYNFRAIPLIIEVIMITRLFLLMRGYGKGGDGTNGQ